MSSSLPATVNLSLREFALHGGLTGPHKDGWGIAYYDDGDVRLVKEAEAASGSRCVRCVGEQLLSSTLVLSHIRKATHGSVSLKNTQPFLRELGGRMHVFAHNGELYGFRDDPKVRLGRFRPVGETDSEWAFCALLERVSSLWLEKNDAHPVPSLAARWQAVEAFARDAASFGPFNFLYADSDALFAFGHKRRRAPGGPMVAPGLYTLCRTCQRQATDAHVWRGEGVALWGAGRQQDVALVASVPLSDEPWQAAPTMEVLILREGRVLRGTDAVRVGVSAPKKPA